MHHPFSGARCGACPPQAIALFCLTVPSGCWWDWGFDAQTHVEAVGEVRDADGRPLRGAEVRLIKYWPIQGWDPIEPPPSVLFAEDVQAPEGAPYGVALAAVAYTDAVGVFALEASAEDVADPRYGIDEHGRVLTAETVMVAAAPAEYGDHAGAWSYGFRYGGYYVHHCERLALTRSSPHLDLDRLDTEGVVDASFARGAVQRWRSIGDGIFDHRVALEPSDGGALPYLTRCRETPAGIYGCASVPGDPERLRMSIPAVDLEGWLDGSASGLRGWLVVEGPWHRTYAPMALAGDSTGPTGPTEPTGPTDPSGGGAGSDPEPGAPPTGSGAEPSPDPASEPPAPAPGDAGSDGPIPLEGVWAVGPGVRLDLRGTAAVDGDPLTRQTLDPALGLADALYVQLGDVRLTEAGILNALVESADQGCLVIQTSPSVYRVLDAAIAGVDWVGSARFCGSTGGLGEVSALQQFTTTGVDGRRAGWLRIVSDETTPLRLAAVGEVVAYGRP